MLIHGVTTTNDKELILNRETCLHTDVVFGIPNNRGGIVESSVFAKNIRGVRSARVESTLCGTTSVSRKDFIRMFPKVRCRYAVQEND